MHDNRVTKVTQVTRPEHDAIVRRIDTKTKQQLKAARKRQRQARKTSR